MIFNVNPSCFFPTKVVIVDDDVNFLDSIAYSLPSVSCTYELFSHPREALDYLNNSPQDYFGMPWFSNFKTGIFQRSDSSLRLEKLYKNIFNPARFETISVVIIDQNMPAMFGLDLCRAIKNPFMKKVLLTGVPDESLSIKAFNAGLIHQFIGKHEFSLPQKMIQCIRHCQTLFFQELSQQMMSHYLYSNLPCVLVSERFRHYFNKIIEDKKIVDYYRLDASGSFVLFDEDGNSWNLFVQNRDQVDANYLEVEELSDEEMASDLKLKIQNGEVILGYCPKMNEPFIKPMEWGPFLIEADKISDDPAFYCALSDRGFEMEPLRRFTFAEYKSKSHVRKTLNT